ncbi:MFS transporter [Flexilinea flocculi]|nr:MFS transporter [Flexilinea flocculi]
MMIQQASWKKNTILFLSSQTFSLFGSMLVQYAITWYITLETQSGVMMTISILCGFLPTLLISPFAGVWADRFDRKLLIILSDALIAVSTLILAILFLTGIDGIWLLFVASILRSFGGGIQSPAVSAFIPELVPEEHLTRVNGISSSLQSLVMLISPILSGTLLSFSSIVLVFFIDVVTAAIAVIIMLSLKTSKRIIASVREKINYFQDMRDGIQYIHDHAFIRILFIYCAIYFVLVSPLAFLTPLQVARTYGNDVWRLTTIEVAYSLGIVAGGILIAAWGGFRNRLHTIVLSYLVVAVCGFLLGVIFNFWVYSILMGIIGLVIPMFNTPFIVMLQERVPENFLGRVFSVLSMISSFVMPFAMLIYGPLADMFRIEWMLIITGLFMFQQGIMMLRNPKLIEAGRPDMQTTLDSEKSVEELR